MAQSMRMHIRGRAAQHGQPLDDAAHAARRQARLPSRLVEPAQLEIDEQRRRVMPVLTRLAGRQARVSFRKVSPERLRGRVSKGHVALLLSFAADQNYILSPIDVFEIEGSQFTIPYP